MIDRKTYLEMCQKVAALPSGVLGIKEKVPDDLMVVYDGVTYYLLSLEISFDNAGNVINTAVIHSLIANSVTRRNLKDVSVYENQRIG
jgi:hypothetical protein